MSWEVVKRARSRGLSTPTLKRYGSTFNLNKAAVAVLDGAQFVRVLRDGNRIRVEACSEEDPNRRRFNRSGHNARFSCGPLMSLIPNRTDIPAALINGAIEFEVTQ